LREPDARPTGSLAGRLLGRVLPYGDLAVVAELPDLAQVGRLDSAVRAARARGEAPWASVVDQVPAACSVLLTVGEPREQARLAQSLADLVGRLAEDGDPAAGATPGRDEDDAPDPPAAVVELPVVYDGEDLDEVARLTGLSVDEVVRRHRGAVYTVAFGGFMPGFAYLAGLDPALHVPRRADPRPRVPAGALAVAGEYTAVYPAATPGGWRLLGRCTATLFDVDRDPPALLSPGTRVRLVEDLP